MLDDEGRVPVIRCPDCGTPMEVQEQSDLAYHPQTAYYECFCRDCVSYWLHGPRGGMELLVDGIETLGDWVRASLTREVNEVLSQFCEEEVVTMWRLGGVR